MASGPSLNKTELEDLSVYNSALENLITSTSSAVNDSDITNMSKDLTSFNDNETLSSTPNSDHSRNSSNQNTKTATEIFLDNLKSNDSSMIFVDCPPSTDGIRSNKQSVIVNLFDNGDEVVIISSDEDDRGLDEAHKTDTPSMSSISSGPATSTTKTDLVTEKEVTTKEIKLFDSVEEFDNNLPDTVTLLRTPYGSKVYLVGTAHFSEQSQDDVSMVIRNVQPDVIMVELCPARIHILKHDEKTLLEEARDMNMTKVRNIIHSSGVINGVFYILLLNMSAKITKELGIAPGGEFRRAVEEAKRLRNCVVQLGDRPINITVQRALHGLSFWQSFKLLWRLVTSNETISKEEIERCKQKDLLEELMREMSGEYPALGDVFVKERDMYLCHSLQMSAQPNSTTMQPVNVVGVVGIGHTVGIKNLWGKVHPSQIPQISIIPPASRSNRIAKFTIKYGTLGLISYGIYKFIRPRISSIL